MILPYNSIMNEHKENCIFCKIINKEIPSSFTYEDDKFVAFLDIEPQSDGHTLLIPKAHYPWMTDVPDEIIGDIFIVTKKLMRKLMVEKNCEFVKIKVIGKDVPHFHIHLIPQYKE